MTDDRGNCFLNQVPPGDYVLVIKVRGRERWREELTLKQNEGVRSELIRLPVLNGASGGKVSAMELNVPPSARNKYRVAISNVQGAKWQDAEVNFREAIRECPTFARAFNGLGVVLEMEGQHEQAERAFRQATALDSKFGEAHLNLGHLLIMLNRRPEAVEELQHVLSIDPRNTRAVSFLFEFIFPRGMMRLPYAFSTMPIRAILPMIPSFISIWHKFWKVGMPPSRPPSNTDDM